MPRGHLFTVCFQSHAGRAEMPNGLALSLSQENAWPMAHALPTSLHPIGCSSGARADGIQAQGRGGGFEGESEGEVMAWVCVCVCVCLCVCACVCVYVCVLPLPIRAFNMPSRDPLLRTAHTSLGCQDNGQQASAVTPHFLCTELSNHDRCRQCRRCHYQGPLHFLPAWPSRRPTAREEGAAGAVVYTKKGTGANLRHL